MSDRVGFRRLWVVFILVLVGSFSVLGYFGVQIYREAPPIPARVVTESGEVLFTAAQIKDGQNVWQSTGGQELGTVWGHGSYVAPDWSADWLHREAMLIVEHWAAAEHGTSFEKLAPEPAAGLTARLKQQLRTNRYDPATGDLVVSADRAAAIEAVARHYRALFSDDPELAGLREAYAMKRGTVTDPERLDDLVAFFFWTSWACVTERPGQQITYTNNWPPEQLVGNVPQPALHLWTGFSVIMLIAGIGGLAWWYAAHRAPDPDPSELPENDPLLGLRPTPSMRATLKYFWVVVALIVVQVLLGGITAHYGVEGSGFYGIDLASFLPYSLARTWHVQLAIFWIATSWLATGLFIAPAVSGHEPRLQRLGVNVLFGALLVIVVGSLAGQWASIMQRLGLSEGFWFGHQGYEYVDLGRFWQIFLFVGLLIWLVLMTRALLPALRTRDANRPLLGMFLVSSVAIALFYGAGLMWGEHTHISMVEYWRWWVVHLWVEGFFEVFATAVIAFLFTRLGLLRVSLATAAVLFATIVFLAGGVLGTMHHLYFTGTPTAVIALGASFSALEVVPLAFIGFEAYHTFKLGHATPWMQRYRWPIVFFTAVAFWNLVGAGLFGFLINPPLPLYYMQGLNLTPLHGHTALFGVYGMLGIGLMLFCLRGIKPDAEWHERTLQVSFWSLNAGLVGMSLMTLLPLGTMQLVAAIENGYWYARSAEFMQRPIVDLIIWMRMPGDVIFSIGGLALSWFVLRLWLKPRRASGKLPVGAETSA